MNVKLNVGVLRVTTASGNNDDQHQPSALADNLRQALRRMQNAAPDDATSPPDDTTRKLSTLVQRVRADAEKAALEDAQAPESPSRRLRRLMREQQEDNPTASMPVMSAPEPVAELVAEPVTNDTPAADLVLRESTPYEDIPAPTAPTEHTENDAPEIVASFAPAAMQESSTDLQASEAPAEPIQEPALQAEQTVLPAIPEPTLQLHNPEDTLPFSIRDLINAATDEKDTYTPPVFVALAVETSAAQPDFIPDEPQQLIPDTPAPLADLPFTPMDLSPSPTPAAEEAPIFPEPVQDEPFHILEPLTAHEEAGEPDAYQNTGDDPVEQALSSTILHNWQEPPALEVNSILLQDPDTASLDMMQDQETQPVEPVNTAVSSEDTIYHRTVGMLDETSESPAHVLDVHADGERHHSQQDNLSLIDNMTGAPTAPLATETPIAALAAVSLQDRLQASLAKLKELSPPEETHEAPVPATTEQSNSLIEPVAPPINSADRIRQLLAQKQPDIQPPAPEPTPTTAPDISISSTNRLRQLLANKIPPPVAVDPVIAAVDTAPETETPSERLARFLRERQTQKTQAQPLAQPETDAGSDFRNFLDDTRDLAADISEDSLSAGRRDLEEVLNQTTPLNLAKSAPEPENLQAYKPVASYERPKPSPNFQRIPAKGNALENLEARMAELRRTQIGRMALSLIDFSRNALSVLTWTVIWLGLSWLTLSTSIVGFDIFSNRYWQALQTVYNSGQPVPWRYIGGFAVMLLIWTAGAVIFWRGGWKYVQNVYGFAGKAVLLPVGFIMLAAYSAYKFFLNMKDRFGR